MANKVKITEETMMECSKDVDTLYNTYKQTVTTWQMNPSKENMDISHACLKMCLTANKRFEVIYRLVYPLPLVADCHSDIEMGTATEEMI